MAEQFGTALTKINDVFAPLIERQLQGNGVTMDHYAKQCVLAALSGIHTALDAKGITWQDPQLDRSNITQVLLSVACLKLNAAANPREVFFQVRNVKTQAKDASGNIIWKKQIEMGIEGDGNDAILARFGRGVREVRQFWLVREGDEFEYPTYIGLEFQPPEWRPSGKGEVVRVVYPIIKTDGAIEFYIAERADVVRNFMAHLSNNLMNETFSIAKDRYSATPEQKQKIDARKAEIMKRANELGLGALDDPDLQAWISPAWSEFHSRESMIIRKMRNNIVKKIPKDFGNAFIELTYAENADEAEAAIRREAAENANGRLIDVEPAQSDPAPATGEEQPAARPEAPVAPPATVAAPAAPEAKSAPGPQRGAARQQTLGVGETAPVAPGPGF